MKKLKIWVAAAFAAAATLVAHGPAQAGLFDTLSAMVGGDGGTKVVAVVGESDFVPDRTGAPRTRLALPDELVDRVIENLTRSKRFEVVERDALRRAVSEQKFGAEAGASDLDRTLDKAIRDMDQVEGLTVAATAAFADYNDLLKDFQNLGSNVGADFLVLGQVEKLTAERRLTNVPYSGGRQVARDEVDARVRLRVVEVATGKVVGATSLRTGLKEWVFAGKRPQNDAQSVYDHVAREASIKLLDILYPAQVASLDPVVVSRGANEGIKVGDRFDILREGKEITDPSGVVLGRLQDKVGSVEVTKVQDTFAIVDAAGVEVEEGDLAVLATAAVPAGASGAAASAPAAAPSATEQPMIAVGLLKAGSTANPNDDEWSVDLFTDTLITRLVQTKRFRVADRQEVNQMLDEQMLEALSNDQDLPSAVGSLKAVDYLMVGNISLFDVQDTTVQLPGTTTAMPARHNARVEGNMRLVDARTGEILTSQKVAVNTDVTGDVTAERLVNDLSDAFSDQIVMILMNNVYPIKVAAVAGETVYLNRGGDGGLAEGETLRVYRLGQAIIDPDTGVSLGQAETEVAELVLSEVEAMRSKAAVISGQPVQAGDLVKRLKENQGRNGAIAQAGTGGGNSLAPKQAVGRSGGMLPGTKTAEAGEPKRFTLALGGVTLGQDARADMAAGPLESRVADVFIAKLSKTNRFQLIEREEMDRLLQEKQFQAGSQNGDFYASLQSLTGADYMVTGEITAFYTASESKKIPYLDTMETTTTGTAEATLRVVDVHTGGVVASDQIRFANSVTNTADPDKVLSDLLDGFTTAATSKVVATIFPVKVLGMAPDGTVYVNRGSDGGFSAGDRFQVMRPGETLRDADTGMAFGAAELPVGILEITAVETARSRARMVEGGEPVGGDILRAAPRKEAPKPNIIKPKW